MNDQPGSENPGPAAGKFPSARVRALLSLLFVVHLSGVFVAPMAASILTAYSIFPDRTNLFRRDSPPRPDARAEALPAPARQETAPANIWLQQLLAPYLDAAYLNHGYNFFAPDPGTSLLIRYEIEQFDGKVLEGKFPDIEEHWPRLRYHRHFMLTSHSLNVLPPEAATAYARYLLRHHHARRVTLRLIQHRLLPPAEVLEGKRLDDPDTYEQLGEVTVTADAPGEGGVREASP